MGALGSPGEGPSPRSHRLELRRQTEAADRALRGATILRRPLGAAPHHLREQSRHQYGTGGAQRMAAHHGATLGIDQIGDETARLLARQFETLETLRTASVSDLAAVHGVGDIVATSLVAWLTSARNRKLLDSLLTHITIETATLRTKQTALSGKTVVLTGTLETITRDEAKDLIRMAGGIVGSSVSKKTDYVVVGTNAGSKATAAAALGITVLSEAAFRALIA